MSLSPVEIRHVQLRRAWLRGYRRSVVDRLLDEIASSFEEVWRERADLADRVEELEAEVAKHRELEELLRSTLVSAERAAQEMREQARREADLIVQEAHAEGRRIAREAAEEKRRLEEDAIRIREQLRTALGVLEGWPGPEVQERAGETASEERAAVEDASDSGIRRIAG
jgi:cell division initiation protein